MKAVDGGTPVGAGQAAALLAWYDTAARRMPWRVGPAERAAGIRPDPYHVWLSEVMLQQTTVAAVGRYFSAFVARWPRLSDLAAAEDAEVMAAWAGLGYYARARNLLKCARVLVAEHGGRFPESEPELRSLPGIGAYTAAAVAAIAFDRPSVVLDGNVERVMARLHAVADPLPGCKARLRRLAAALTPADRPGDYAQAVMDLGATVCTPRRPACGLCPWAGACTGRRAGLAAELPRKSARSAKPLRRGIAYLAIRDDGAVLLETRPAQGLLGGMLAVPCSEWTEGPPQPRPPFSADWRDTGLEVRHTFTHFHLRLGIMTAPAESAVDGRFERWSASLENELPTLMRKVIRLGAPLAKPL